MNPELGLSLIILGGFLAAKLFSTAKIPAVTSYILVGIVIGPMGLDIIPEGFLAASGFISDVVLGLIAFSIGSNFSPDHTKKIRSAVIRISVMEALGAMILVTLGLFFILGEPIEVAILFGAIATATAPAATLMVIEELKARGPLTDTLLGVVALDDAWSLMLFAIALVMAKIIALGETTGILFATEIGMAMVEIAATLLLGTVFAWLLHHYSKRVKDPSDLEILTLGIILLTVGVASTLDISVILSCLVLGVALININPEGFRFFDIVHPVDTPLYLIFFVLAGALLEVELLMDAGLLGAAYIVFRVAGKVGGAYLGGSISGEAGLAVRKYIGLGLVPQAGVALGVALIAREQFPGVGDMVFSTIVATTVIFELVGPVATRTALSLAGEVHSQ